MYYKKERGVYRAQASANYQQRAGREENESEGGGSIMQLPLMVSTPLLTMIPNTGFTSYTRECSETSVENYPWSTDDSCLTNAYLFGNKAVKIK